MSVRHKARHHRSPHTKCIPFATTYAVYSKFKAKLDTWQGCWELLGVGVSWVLNTKQLP
jgi:hypothetical protein